MIRKLGLAAASIFSLALVAGCGSSGTPTPPPISDPIELINQAVTKAPDVSTFHLKIDIAGKINTAALGSSGSSLGLGGSMDLAGTKIEGDIDVKKAATDLKFTMPGLMGLSGEVIVVDGSAYYKISLLGEKYTQSKLSDLTGGLPVSVPSALPSGSAIADQVAEFRKQLQDAGVTMTMKPDDKVDGQAVYHVSVNLPLEKINTLLAAEGGSGAAAMKLDSANVETWFYKDTLLPAKFEIAGSSSSIGNLDIVISMTAYNKGVTVAAPPADQIQAGN